MTRKATPGAPVEKDWSPIALVLRELAEVVQPMTIFPRKAVYRELVRIGRERKISAAGVVDLILRGKLPPVRSVDAETAVAFYDLDTVRPLKRGERAAIREEAKAWPIFAKVEEENAKPEEAAS